MPNFNAEILVLAEENWHLCCETFSYIYRCVFLLNSSPNSLRARAGDLVLWDLLGFIVEYTVFKGAEFKSDGRHAVKVEHFKLFTKIQYGRHRNTIYTLFDWKKYTLGAIFLISRRMWYVRILWLIIYKLRPFWEKIGWQLWL